MKVEQKEKRFVPVTITLETEKELKLLHEITNVIDLGVIEDINYITYYGETKYGEIDDFATELYDEIAKNNQ